MFLQIYSAGCKTCLNKCSSYKNSSTLQNWSWSGANPKWNFNTTDSLKLQQVLVPLSDPWAPQHKMCPSEQIFIPRTSQHAELEDCSGYVCSCIIHTFIWTLCKTNLSKISSWARWKTKHVRRTFLVPQDSQFQSKDTNLGHSPSKWADYKYWNELKISN